MEIPPPQSPDFSADEAAATCTSPLHPQALIGLRLFNRGEYFDAHEALETAWRAEPSPACELYRGILQVGVAYYHIQRGNYSGALKLLDRAQSWLAPFPPVCRGIHVEELRQSAQRVKDEVLRCGSSGLNQFNRQFFQPVVFDLS